MAKKRTIGSQFRLLGLTENFWDEGKYKRVVTRIEDGNTLCTEFARMVHERALIEKKFASMLKNWSQRWELKIERGMEYPDGSIRNGWRALLDESDRVSEVHANVSTKLMKEVRSSVLKWRKENYIKSVMSLKEAKKAEDGFAAAQKPWAKLRAKANKAKKRYYARCAAEKSLNNKVREAEKSMAPEELAKLKSRWIECKTAMEQARKDYDAALKDVENDVPRYEREMKAQFVRCQDHEQKRIDFFKRTMLSYQGIVEKSYGNIWAELKENIVDVNADADLVKYAERHGVGMQLVVPAFVEFGQPEKVVVPPRHMVLSQNRNSTTLADDVESDPEEDWEDDKMAPPPSDDVTSTGVGVKVCALYDYDAEEEGEVSFKAGDVFMQIEEEDDQGWCRGVLSDGLSGLFPASYVELVE